MRTFLTSAKGTELSVVIGVVPTNGSQRFTVGVVISCCLYCSRSAAHSKLEQVSAGLNRYFPGCLDEGIWQH